MGIVPITQRISNSEDRSKTAVALLALCRPSCPVHRAPLHPLCVPLPRTRQDLVELEAQTLEAGHLYQRCVRASGRSLPDKSRG